MVFSEAELLRARGVEVRLEVFDNEPSQKSGLDGLVQLPCDCAWSRRSYTRVMELCREFRPDIVHVHNFWMKLSPSVHAASRHSGIASVQTLHNFRLLCTNALLFRNGHACEDCVGKTPWRGVMRRCYRHSAIASGAVAAMIFVNRSRGTWEREVDAWIALAEHSRQKFTEAGLPSGKIFVKPNFVPDPGPPVPPSSPPAVLYAGRLSPEKGVGILLKAWERGRLGHYGRLLLAGDGPERIPLERMAASLNISSSVEFLGHLDSSALAKMIQACRAVVAPSLCFENFPRVVVEAFAHGRPVIAANIGALNEIVNQHTGLRFPAGDCAALADALASILCGHRAGEKLGEAARVEYLRNYTPERNYQQLMSIYSFACKTAPIECGASCASR